MAAAAVVVARWSWLKWPDVITDFGTELYVAWQLASGRVLYRDVAYLNGPLSPYVNALWFRLFGVGLRTLVGVNLILLAVVIWLLYRILAQMSDRVSATVACLVFVLLFAFGQYVGIGNYNFVCPYRHEVTHGMLLSLAAIHLLWSRERRGRRVAAGVGVAAGLIFLGKAEVFVAALAAIVVGLASQTRAELARERVAVWAVFTAAFAVPPVLAFALLWAGMPARAALHGTLGTWPVLWSGAFTASPFYRQGIGVDDPAHNLAMVLRWTAAYAGVLGPPALLGLLLRRRGPHRPVIAVVVLVLVAALLVANLRWIDWANIARPLPVVMLALAVASWWRLRARGGDDARLGLRHTMSVFALVLLGKMLLNARIHHYGFVLAMPATLLLVLAALCWLPRRIERAGGYGGITRATGAAVLAVTIFVHLRVAEHWFAGKSFQVGRGVDAFVADVRGPIVQDAVDEIARRLGPDATLAAFPEGTMLNYLARRPNPTPFTFVHPPELAYLDEDRVLSSLEAHPPDYVALVHFDSSEHGYRFFGRDYGLRIGDWVSRNYRGVALAGAPPFQGPSFGIRLMERVDRSARPVP